MGKCLVSQHLREKIVRGAITASARNTALDEEGRFCDASLEDRVQPSSFEPLLTETLWRIDPEYQGLFRPHRLKTVRESILGLPSDAREEIDISGGYEVKVGHSYLLRLDTRVQLGREEWIRSSPKSSIGRLFPRTRLMGDYNPGLDQLCGGFSAEPLDLWLMLEPQAFNMIVRPEIPMNQLRLFDGHPEKVPFCELEGQPLLYWKDKGGVLSPRMTQGWSGGLQIHLDLVGERSAGVCGLRARRNPHPIDLAKAGEYRPEKYFEPLLARDVLKVSRGEKLLLVSKEVLSIPLEFDAELQRHASVGIRGSHDEAGFIDNGFDGDLVLEMTPDELTTSLSDGMPMSEIELFRCLGIPDKAYGKRSGAHYQGQQGPKISKHFGPFDFEHAARNFRKLERNVLVCDRNRVVRKIGARILEPAEMSELLEEVRNGFFHSRYSCEDDPHVIQPIPYVVLFDGEERVFSYKRSEDIRSYGAPPLFGRRSLGLGGHIGPEDALRPLHEIAISQLEREVRRSGARSDVRIVGSVYATDEPVDLQHLGLIGVCWTDGNVNPKDPGIAEGRFVPIDSAGDDPSYESWSKRILPLLPNLYRLARTLALR